MPLTEQALRAFFAKRDLRCPFTIDAKVNESRWDAAAASWARHAECRGIWPKCHEDPTLALHPGELRWLNDVAGKGVAVLGSGDNQVVFALAGMGARVTSVDISEQQLDIARQRAAELRLNIRFLRADVVELSALADSAFDVVYTGGHVAVWVSDLRRFYSEAVRILNPDGRLVISEYHPFRRVWKDRPDRLELAFSYFDRGPHHQYASTDLFDARPGDVAQFEFHWTVSDYVSAVIASRCQIVHVEEFGDASEEWETAPLAGLPANLLLVARRIRGNE